MSFLHSLCPAQRLRALSATAAASCLFMVAGGALAQTAPTAPAAARPLVEEQRQQDRERALRDQQERSVDERLPAQTKSQDQRLPPDESPCFRIDRVLLTGDAAEQFQWTLSAASGPQGDDTPIGRCLGTAGVNTVLARLQQALIARGWVTTRVLAAPQDLATGTLTLTLVPGRIAAIRFAEGSSSLTSLLTAIPARVGDLLNLRDIEQGLENFKRLPTAEADIQIEPSGAAHAKPGDSDLVVKYSQKMPLSSRLRVTLSLDDSGTGATGRLQTGATLAWDNPLGLNDLLYVSLNHDAFNHPGAGTSGQTVHYSVPFGDWLLGATASQGKYHQSVQGLSQNYVYAGETRNAEVRLSRLVYRDASRKTTLSLRGFRRASSNAIDDTEVLVQRRVVAGWEASVNHKEFLGEATLEGTLAYRRATHAFGALPAPEDAFNEGTSYFHLVTAEVSANVPFKLADQKLRYSTLWRAQWNGTPLTPQDRFAIGGRYTVRGFDGESLLLGDRGWLLRNDLGWALGASGAELYVGLDYGHVGGRSTRDLLGNHLAGVALGVRGTFKGLNYDLFIGTPLVKPAGYRASSTTGGFNLNYSF